MSPLRHRSRYIQSANVELRTIAFEEGRMPPAFIFLQDVHLTLKFGVRRNRTRPGYHLPALNIRPIQTAQQQPYIVASLPLIQQLAEHPPAWECTRPLPSSTPK